MAADDYTVAPPEDRRRVLFAGTKEAATQFMEDHFPWPHSDGDREVHGAVLIAPDGKSHQTYHRHTGLSDPMDRDGNPIAAPAPVEATPVEATPFDVVPVEPTEPSAPVGTLL